jgi:hypothetical protein
MKAIKTKFLPCTNFRGNRIKATDEDGNAVTLSWDHGLNAEENHRAVAYALRDKMGWRGELITGVLRDCYVHVFDPSTGPNYRPLKESDQ